MDHMAGLHAALWGWTDDVGLVSLHNRYSIMTLARIEVAAKLAHRDRAASDRRGRQRLPSLEPAMAETLFALHADPSPLVDALADTPWTFLHGDWKMANLGTGPDGRSILVDWSFPAPARRPPSWPTTSRSTAKHAESKEAAIAAYRAALEAHGVANNDWWDRQLPSPSSAIMCALGWRRPWATTTSCVGGSSGSPRAPRCYS